MEEKVLIRCLLFPFFASFLLAKQGKLSSSAHNRPHTQLPLWRFQGAHQVNCLLSSLSASHHHHPAKSLIPLLVSESSCIELRRVCVWGFFLPFPRPRISTFRRQRPQPSPRPAFVTCTRGELLVLRFEAASSSSSVRQLTLQRPWNSLWRANGRPTDRSRTGGRSSLSRRALSVSVRRRQKERISKKPAVA